MVGMNESPKPVVVLVETQMAMNIGMCARAMLNCGLDELRLVSPRDGWPNDEALAPARESAERLIRDAKCYDTLVEATADCQFVYAATARNRQLNTPAMPPTEAAAEIRKQGGKAALVFGPEARGLSNEDVALANVLVHYPMNPEFTSLNLAQAVLLMGWEWWRQGEDIPQSYADHWQPAPQGEVAYFLKRLERMLDARGFFPNELKKPSTVQKLHSLFHRMNPTEQELRSLQGILTSLGGKSAPESEPTSEC